MLKISVITPTFNAEKTLERTINSVVGQGYPDLEYIVVDGLSTDGTLSIAERRSAGISRLISEKDRGIYDAMNKGIRSAQGDWIGILNADDVYADGVLRRVAELAERHPDAEVFYADIRMVFANRPEYLLKSQARLATRDFWQMPVWHPTMFVRRDVYQRQGAFLDTYRISSDYEFVLRLHLAGIRFYHVDSVWVRMDGGGASDVKWRLGKQELKSIAKSHGVFRGLLRIRFHLDMLKVGFSERLQSVPVLKNLQAAYRKAKSKLEPGF